MGFWVAMTMKERGAGWVTPPTVTCDSSMTSSSADWVLGLARLTSSARTTWANTGPAWKTQSPVFWS